MAASNINQYPNYREISMPCIAKKLQKSVSIYGYIYIYIYGFFYIPQKAVDRYSQYRFNHRNNTLLVPVSSDCAESAANLS